jgi:4-hydroxy-4-methyl-2-oxoglutarate aldolase
MSSLVGRVFATPGPSASGVVALARELGVATIVASMEDSLSQSHLVPNVRLPRITGTNVASGRAVTVWNASGNNTMVGFGLQSCCAGDVLVVSTPTDGVAQWGKIAQTWALATGVAGVIINGAIRDAGQIREFDLSLWARCIHPGRAAKEELGFVNAPIQVADVTICPGDLIVADDDGILALPANAADDIIENAKALGDEIAIRADAAKSAQSQYIERLLPADRVQFVGRPWTVADGTYGIVDK